MKISKDEDTRSRATVSLNKVCNDKKYKSLVIQAYSHYQLDNQEYDLIWKWSQNMTYPEFYQAWHQS
ncbi:hypothetical protein [Anabaena catenula]|uniref:hypothetical protein n=1 Tax=Anabaena catenula TaxID=1296320 RepID=UPI003BB811C2